MTAVDWLDFKNYPDSQTTSYEEKDYEEKERYKFWNGKLTNRTLCTAAHIWPWTREKREIWLIVH